MELKDITGLLAVLISIASLVNSYRRAPHEEKNLDAESSMSSAEAAKTHEEAAALAGERANRLEREIVALRAEVQSQQKTISDQGKLIDFLVAKDKEKEERIKCLEDENKSLVERVKILESENGDLIAYSSKLVTQVKNLGGTPIQLKEGRR